MNVRADETLHPTNPEPTSNKMEEKTSAQNPSSDAKISDEKDEKGSEGKKVFQELTSNDDEEKVELNLRTLLGGEAIEYFIRKRILYFGMLTFMAIIYVTNRYSYQSELVEQKKLIEKLEDRRLRAVVATSSLIEYTRRSNIQEVIHDTTLHQTVIPHRYLRLNQE